MKRGFGALIMIKDKALNIRSIQQLLSHPESSYSSCGCTDIERQITRRGKIKEGLNCTKMDQNEAIMTSVYCSNVLLHEG